MLIAIIFAINAGFIVHQAIALFGQMAAALIQCKSLDYSRVLFVLCIAISTLVFQWLYFFHGQNG